jgi:hypothetical protein
MAFVFITAVAALIVSLIAYVRRPSRFMFSLVAFFGGVVALSVVAAIWFWHPSEP